MILGNFHCFSSSIDRGENFWKVCWPVQVAILNSSLICLYNSIDTIAFWVKDIAVQGKTVWCSAFGWWDKTSETIKWNFLIWIIVLKNFTDCLHSLEVLIPPWITTMKRVRSLSWVTIWQREVNCDIQVDLTSTEDILQEIYGLFQLKLFNMNHVRFEL